MRTLLAVGALLLAAPPATAAIFHAEGSFLAGTPASYSVVDACGNDGVTDGIDSSCIGLPDNVWGMNYRVQLTGTGLAGARVCFYDDIQFMACFEDADLSARIPTGAKTAAFCSFAAAMVSWTFDV